MYDGPIYHYRGDREDNEARSAFAAAANMARAGGQTERSVSAAPLPQVGADFDGSAAAGADAGGFRDGDHAQVRRWKRGRCGVCVSLGYNRASDWQILNGAILDPFAG